MYFYLFIFIVKITYISGHDLQFLCSCLANAAFCRIPVLHLNVTRPRESRPTTVRQTFVARCRIVPEQGKPAGPRPAHWAPCFLKVHSFYAVRSTSSPPKSCRLLSDRGERGPEPLPGAALLRPFYRPGAGVRRRPRSARGRASQGSGEAPPRRSWRRGAAAQRAPLPRPPPRLGGASGGAPARPVSLRRAPPAAAGPGPAGIGAGGCDGRAGWGRSGRAAAAAFSCAGPEGSAARAAVRAVREEGRASASPPLRVRQPSAVGVGERRSAQAGGRARPRRLAGRWSEAARLEEDGRWRRRRRLQRQLVSGRCVHGWQGESGPWAAFPSGNRRGARYGLGDGGGERVCVCASGGRNGSPWGDDDNERCLGGVGEGWVPWRVASFGKKRPASGEGLARGIWFLVLSFFLYFSGTVGAWRSAAGAERGRGRAQRGRAGGGSGRGRAGAAGPARLARGEGSAARAALPAVLLPGPGLGWARSPHRTAGPLLNR